MCKYNSAVSEISSVPTVAVHTLGCKLNQAESEIISCELTRSGFAVVDGKRAEAFVINTCSVTHIADRKSRHLVRMLRSHNPGAVIAVTGCYAERCAGRDLESCGADMVAGNADKLSLPAMLAPRCGAGKFTGYEAKKRKPGGRVRSFIRVQDGCRNFCTYCIVPYLRKSIASVDAVHVVAEARERVSEGCQEVVLTGTEIGSYSCGTVGLPELVHLLLESTAVSRLHLSSLQPQHVSLQLLEQWCDTRMVRHFHLALQSGSASVLQRMGRRYTPETYRGVIQMIRSKVPDASVTTDVIVGFPGETADEFEQGYRFCRDMEFSAIHVFPFSARPGTAAAAMPDRVKDTVKKERSSRMLELAADSARRFAASFCGDTRPVLWENEVRRDSGLYQGLTDNYVRVYAGSGHDIQNRVIMTRLVAPAADKDPAFITRTSHGELWGELTI